MDKGYAIPRTLSEWSDIDFIMYSGYWVKEHEREYVERFKFYTKLATDLDRTRTYLRPLRYVAAMRSHRDYYDYPIEKEFINFVRYKILHRVNW